MIVSNNGKTKSKELLAQEKHFCIPFPNPTPLW